MEKRKVIITDIKTGLATISGYHPDSYSTQLLISGVNKDVDKLIADHKAVVEIYKDKISSLEENRLAQFDLLTIQQKKIKELEKERFDFAHAYYAHVKDDELIKKAFGILRGD
jgi:hypothetical protein